MAKKKKGPAKTPSNLRRMFLRERGRCFWCNKELTINGPRDVAPTKDHVLPRSKGGTGKITNLVLSCHDCNGAKGNYLINPVTNEPISPEVLWVFLKED